MVDKICLAQLLTQGITALFVLVWLLLEQTPVTVKDMSESMFNQLASALLPEEFHLTWSKFAKGACQAAQRAKLLEAKLNSTTAAKNARKACQRQTNKVLKTGGILYTKDARVMVRDRLKVEGKRENKRQTAWKKRYKTALQKCYKGTKKFRATEIDKVKKKLSAGTLS